MSFPRKQAAWSVCVLSVLSLAAPLAMAQPPLPPPASPGPPIEALVRCGEPGQACCRWPGAPASAVDPVHCNRGAGCDLGTGTCVATCGGSGQACCDGPDTRAVQWTLDGKMLQPSGPFVRDMCDGGVCLASRRCDTTCGRTAGGPCCSPDVAIATATCKQADLVCGFDPNTLKSGTCLSCGREGEPACDSGGCRTTGLTRTVERNGVCVACGLPGSPKCDGLRKCGPNAAPDPLRDRCVVAGGLDEPCLEGGFCGFDGMFCDASKKCRLCGAPGQRCCPDEALLGGGRLLECGGFSNVRCEGSGSQRFCQLMVPPSPDSPPASNPARTCGGQPFVLGVTQRFEVWLRLETGCADRAPLRFANSLAEALACARAGPGDVIEGVVTSTPASAVSSVLGCQSFEVTAANDEDAQSCAEALCGINCEGTAQLVKCEDRSDDR